ncbi:MAG: beta-lactamase family protein [Gemmatimonadota bacterium]|nr:beta-lactamase family protein [Gemmatimonadota bacterium]
MRDTTFDFARAQSGNWARPHSLDINGRMARVPTTMHYAVLPHRPAGGAWSTAADMARYVQLELSKGLTPDGKRLVSETNLLERRKRGVSDGEDSWYGMGLNEQLVNGVTVVNHGGALFGYKSDFFVLPEVGIGAVILTNADEGGAILRPFLRRLLEVVYDGKPEAMLDIKAAAGIYQARIKSERDRITLPGNPSVLAGLAPRYTNPELGELTVRRKAGQAWIKSGVVDSPYATIKNADGTQSLIAVGPSVVGFELVIGKVDGKRTLIVRDSQHEYVYVETS